jgi:hypothetical protein
MFALVKCPSTLPPSHVLLYPYNASVQEASLAVISLSQVTSKVVIVIKPAQPLLPNLANLLS